MPHRLLDAFEAVFNGHPYRHRSSNQGDWVAAHLYEDLRELGRSTKLAACLAAGECVVNAGNLRQGVQARRGDGTFGDRVMSAPLVMAPGFNVPRGKVANVHVGVEVKILSKAMIKQIDRVEGDLRKQLTAFRKRSRSAITVGVVGVNHAAYTVSFEGDRSFRPTGQGDILIRSKKLQEPKPDLPRCVTSSTSSSSFDTSLRTSRHTSSGGWTA